MWWRRRQGRWTSPCKSNLNCRPSHRTACWRGTRLRARRSTTDRWRTCTPLFCTLQTLSSSIRRSPRSFQWLRCASGTGFLPPPLMSRIISKRIPPVGDSDGISATPTLPARRLISVIQARQCRVKEFVAAACNLQVVLAICTPSSEQHPSIPDITGCCRRRRT